MKTQNICELTAEQYLLFLDKQHYVAFNQEPLWGSVKTDWKKTYIGLYDTQQNLCAATMLMLDETSSGCKIAYAPRGFVLNYKNRAVLNVFFSALKKYAKENKIVSIVFDPYIDVDNQLKMGDKTLVSQIEQAGAVHRGFGLNLESYMQPRFHCLVKLKNADGTLMTREQQRQTLKPRVRSYIGDYQKIRGLEFELQQSEKDLLRFMRLIDRTKQRQNIDLRSAGYFQNLFKVYKENAFVLYAKLNLKIFIEFLAHKIKAGINVDAYQQMLDAAREKRRTSDKLDLACGLFLLPESKCALRVCEYIYGGSDPIVAPNLGAPTGLLFEAMAVAREYNCDYLNLGGIEGNLKDNLYQFKKKFSPIVLELIGEFEIQIDSEMSELLRSDDRIRKKR